MYDSALTVVKELADNYLKYKNERISLIASENISSKLQLSSYLLGLCDQYCSRLPSDKDIVDNLTFGNIGPLDDINHYTREIVKDIFKAGECEIRLLSGLNGLTVLLFSLLKDGDTIFKVHDSHGGHLSVKPIAQRLNLNIFEMTIGDDYVLDFEYFYKNYKVLKPKVIFLDSSYNLFPYPVRKIKECISSDTLLVYDASHVIALVAGGQFQDPFSEGADIIHSTTHKTLWGPQKAMLLFRDKGEPCQRVQDIVKNVLVSNTHVHHIFSLLIALLELKEFGREYAGELVQNNKYLAECMEQQGFNIAAKEYGYTQSNQFWVDCGTKNNAVAALKSLQAINISCNMIFLPKERWGLRIGTNELTRKGIDKSQIGTLARIMADAVFERDKRPALINRSRELKNELQDLKYTFDSLPEAKELMDLFTSNSKELSLFF